MKKVFVILFLLIGLCAQGVVLKGGVHYTVESAREEAFSRVKYKISMDEHKKYLKDPGFSLDKNGKPKIRKFGRDVTFFSGGEYCVYYLASGYVYFYNTNGNLLSLLNQSERSNSVLIQKYDTTGNLIKVFFDITSEHSYVYNPDKTYEGQWIGENFYDVNGKITDTRTKWE